MDILDASSDLEDGVLGHADQTCHELYPLISRVPRLLVGGARSAVAVAHSRWFEGRFGRRFGPEWSVAPTAESPDLRIVARFDSEWRAFPEVGTLEQEQIFRDYFDLAEDALAQDSVVLDAGCGSGRWAYQAAARGARVLAVDLGGSIDVAERNTRSLGRVVCVQGDVRRLPITGGSVDVAYCLGVLHHIRETELALAEITRVVRRGGRVLIYLYYALDERARPFRTLFSAVDAVRRVTSSLPQRHIATVSFVTAAVIYWPLARLARALRAIGLGSIAATLPLAYYADRSFSTMRNDSLDRLGTALEKRFTRSQVVSMLEQAGIHSIQISPRAPYWHAVGVR